HRLIEYYERFVPGAIRQGLVPRVIGRVPTSFDNISLDFRMKRFISGRGVPMGVRHHQWLGSFTPSHKKKLLKDWAQTHDLDAFQSVSSHEHNSQVKKSMNNLLYWDMKMYLEGGILQKVDRASMACSLEVRVPLLNNRFVDWATSVPVDLKLRGLTTKYL